MMSGTGAQDPLAMQHASVTLVWWGGVAFLGLGLLKMVIYSLGRWWPGLYGRIGSETVRGFFTGRGNRLLFGIGGLVTAGLGLFFMAAAKALEWLVETVSR